MSLSNKSIHELRSIAEGYGISDVFSKKPHELKQAIELKQTAVVLKEKYVPLPRNEYDSRLMTKRPSDSFTNQEAVKALENHINLGLKITFPEPDRWHMNARGKEDNGTTRMPLRVLLDCADRILK